jgi:Spy/CpxP family protein refolding chaperone
MKKSVWIMTAIVLVWTTGALAAGPYGKGRHQGKGMNIPPEIVSALELTPEQTQKIRSLRVDHQKDVMPLRTQKFEKRAELRLLWMQMTPDVEKIKAKQKEMHDIEWQIREKSIDFRLAMRNVLTEEQLSKFLAMGGEWQGKRDKHRGPRGKGGYGHRHGQQGAMQQ